MCIYILNLSNIQSCNFKLTAQEQTRGQKKREWLKFF